MIRQWTLKEWIMEQHVPPEVADKVELLFKLPDQITKSGHPILAAYVHEILNSPPVTYDPHSPKS